MKKKLISMLAVCSIACCIGAGMQIVNAKGEDYTSAIAAVAGANVRVDTDTAYNNGIRFNATVDASVYKTLEDSETATRTVDYGMVVVPLDYKTEHGDFTKDNLFDEQKRVYYIDGVTEAASGLVKLGGGYVKTLRPHETDSTKMLLSGSLLNIATSQLTREFVGVPYICITDNGVKEYHVASYNDSRSMIHVAQLGIQSGILTDDEEKYLTEKYLNYKDDTVDIASKEYSYTVEHIALDSKGNVLEVFESTTGEKKTLGTTVSVEANEYIDYTYDESLSTASDIIYANNRTALKMYYKLDSTIEPHLRQENNAIITGMSLEKETEGDFAGAYKYVNGQLGRAGTYKDRWGELGVAFNEIYNANEGYIDAEHQTFFDKKYQYVKLDFYAESSVYSFDFRHGSSTSEGWLQELKADSTFSSNSVFEIYDKNGEKVNKWTAGEWYTLVIKPTQGAMLFLQTNAESSTSEAPVMYIKNLAYRTVHPFAKTQESANLYIRTDKGSNHSVAYQTEGDFAGCWKFTNGNYTTETQCGFMFDQLQQSNGTRITTFFDNGYQYISLQFYVATSTVDSIDLRHGNKTDRYYTDGKACEQNNGDIFTIYDADGNKVTTLTAGAWYTLVIKPEKDAEGSASAGVYINLRETDNSQEAPVMYIKNPTYLVGNPFAN